MSERFSELVNRGSKTTTSVLIDTPPILAVTDAAIVGRHVGTTLMAALCGEHAQRSRTSLSRFEQKRHRGER